MRTIPLALLLGLSTSNYGQFGTVYVTPPTDGCNGVWAVQVTSLYCTSTSPYTFVMEPSGCMQLDNWDEEMGVFLMPLCAIPCSLTVTTGDSVTCSGSTSDAPIGLEEDRAPVVKVNANGAILEVSSSIPLPQLEVRILDMEGRLQSTRTLAPGRNWQLAAPETAGAYFLVIDGMEDTITAHFVIFK